MALNFQPLFAGTLQGELLTALGGVTHGCCHLLENFPTEECVGERGCGEAVIDGVLDLGHLIGRWHPGVVGVVVGVVDGQPVGGFQAQRQAVGGVVFTGQVRIDAGEVVGGPAVVFHFAAGDLHRQHVRHLRQVDRAGKAAIAVVAHARFKPAPEFAGGFARGHVDRPPGAIAPEQCSLRAAQYFDGLQVDDIENCADRFAHVDAVEVEAGLRVGHQ